MRDSGRAAESLRKIKITRDYMKFAEGSCLIEVGNTKVVCTASVEDGVPMFRHAVLTRGGGGMHASQMEELIEVHGVRNQ